MSSDTKVRLKTTWTEYSLNSENRMFRNTKIKLPCVSSKVKIWVRHTGFDFTNYRSDSKAIMVWSANLVKLIVTNVTLVLLVPHLCSKQRWGTSIGLTSCMYHVFLEFCVFTSSIKAWQTVVIHKAWGLQVYKETLVARENNCKNLGVVYFVVRPYCRLTTKIGTMK